MTTHHCDFCEEEKPISGFKTITSYDLDDFHKTVKYKCADCCEEAK